MDINKRRGLTKANIILLSVIAVIIIIAAILLFYEPVSTESTDRPDRTNRDSTDYCENPEELKNLISSQSTANEYSKKIKRSCGTIDLRGVNACDVDLNNNNIVDRDDLIILIDMWDCSNCPADFNSDSSVNAADLIALLDLWGIECSDRTRDDPDDDVETDYSGTCDIGKDYGLDSCNWEFAWALQDSVNPFDLTAFGWADSKKAFTMSGGNLHAGTSLSLDDMAGYSQEQIRDQIQNYIQENNLDSNANYIIAVDIEGSNHPKDVYKLSDSERSAWVEAFKIRGEEMASAFPNSQIYVYGVIVLNKASGDIDQTTLDQLDALKKAGLEGAFDSFTGALPVGYIWNPGTVDKFLSNTVELSQQITKSDGTPLRLAVVTGMNYRKKTIDDCSYAWCTGEYNCACGVASECGCFAGMSQSDFEQIFKTLTSYDSVDHILFWTHLDQIGFVEERMALYDAIPSVCACEGYELVDDDQTSDETTEETDAESDDDEGDAETNFVPLPMGTVNVITNEYTCDDDFSCYQIEISCPTLTSTEVADIRVGEPLATSRGTVSFVSGGGGQTYWGDRHGDISREGIQRARELGFQTIEMKWPNGWGSGSSINDGFEDTSCRPATAYKWMNEELHSSGAFCATGNSGGAAQLAYTLSRHDFNEFDLAVITGGPPMGRIDLGCIQDDASISEVWYDQINSNGLDRAWGFPTDGSGPCGSHDPSYKNLLWEASTVYPTGRYNIPNTYISIMHGEDAEGNAEPQGLFYLEALEDGGQNPLSFDLVPATGHGVYSTEIGIDYIINKIDDECFIR